MATFFTFMGSVSDSNSKMNSFYDISIDKIDGTSLNLKDFKGKYILIVNVASKCGFTKQYSELQELYEKYNDKLVIIGIPCNQFGGQEPGTNDEIITFCKLNYGVSFPITEKVDVKGKNQHPIYEWLTKKTNNSYKDSSVKWNFQKYIISPNGELLDYFFSTTKPLSTKITAYIK
jgi:glutathione peroxidase